MKICIRLMITFALLFASTAHAQKVSVMQVEHLRSRPPFRPDPAQLPPVPILYFSGYEHTASYSAHATEVARILLGGHAKNLVETLYISEASSYDGHGNLNGTRYLEPVKVKWEVENHSYGVNDLLWNLDIMRKFDYRIERDNVLAFVGPPNAGQGYINGRYLVLKSTSKNAVKVGTTASGMDLIPASMPDIYVPVVYTSYAIPTAAQTGIAMIAWCKQNAVEYKWSDLKRIMIEAADVDAQNRRILNHARTMEKLAAFYNKAPVPPVVVDPLPPPPPAPAPVIGTFVASKQSVIVGETVTVSWTTENSTSLVFTHNGAAQEVTGTLNKQIVPVNGENRISLLAKGAGGETTKSLTIYARLKTLAEWRTEAAQSVGAMYNESTGTFTVHADKLGALQTALAKIPQL